MRSFSFITLLSVVVDGVKVLAFGEFGKSCLDSVVAVFETRIEHCAFGCFVVPKEFAFGNLQTEMD